MIVPTNPPPKPASIALPIAVLIVAMFSFQVGASLAKQLFALVGVSGTTALRLGLGSALLLIGWRPWRMRPSLRELKTLVIYGLAMGAMNLFFYLSLHRIPLGIAVSLEFVGPLAVAVGTSRHAVDFAWIVLAIVGITALMPLGFEAKSLDPVGIACALAAAVCWALYILAGRKAGNAHGGQTTALGALIAAAVIVPIGIVQAGATLLAPKIWPMALGLAILSTALPYTLEMFALTRLPTRTFGVLMSGDPVLAALSGLILLGEELSAVQWAGILSIMIASAGSALTGRRRTASTD